MATISVRGQGTACVQPDEVTVGLSVEVLRPTASEAFVDATRLAQQVVSLSEEVGVSSGARSTSRVSLAEHGEHADTGWQHRGYRGATRVAARLNVRVDGPEPGSGPPLPPARMYAVRQEISPMPLEAGEHEVAAEVDVTFQLEQG